MSSSTRQSKRKISPSESKDAPAKRPRKEPSQSSRKEVIIIDDSESEEDEELKEILAQIKNQERSEALAKQLQNDPSFGDEDHRIDLEDDAAVAQKFADAWAAEDNILTKKHHDEEVGNSSDVEFVTPIPTAVVSTSAQKRAKTPSFSKYNHEPSSHTSSKPDEVLENHRNLFTAANPCSKCGNAMNPPRGCVAFTSPEIPPTTMVYLLHLACRSCRTNHCRGCLKPISCPRTCKGPTKNPQCSVLTCCAEVRATAIFEILGGFDREFMSERVATNTRAMSTTHARKAANASVGPGGTGYGTGHGAIASRGRAPAPKTTTLKGFTSRAISQWDTIILNTLLSLVSLLPEPYTDEPQVYDMLPHSSIGHLISMSQLPTLLASLLRNDSVTDWIARQDTYYAMLSLLRRMADCELTIKCLIGEQLEMESTCGLENWMWGDGEINWKKDSSGNLEIVPPLYTHFKKLTKQCEAFLAGASQMLGAGGDEDGEVDETVIQGTSICGDIIAARDDLERAITILGQPTPSDARENRTDGGKANNTRQAGKGKGKARDISLNVDKIYEEACERLCFKHISLADAATGHGGLKYSNFMYKDNLIATETATRVPKSRLHLLKELAVTATSLPPGVWVRVDEVRNDALKIMIAGPEGTPYSGGLFEFDCFLPLEYPATPPLMHLRTTGGGTVRFNPNLYNNGKVCLSLLGTWPGRPEEQWSPKSTLLQVLVSIQSMILIDAPYFNEPGHGQANVKAPVSISYNRNISLQTTKWAIVDWLDDKNRNGIWRDVIHSHFTILKEKIRKQIVEWATSEPQIRSYRSAGGSVYNHNGFFVPAIAAPPPSMLSPAMHYQVGLGHHTPFGSLPPFNPSVPPHPHNPFGTHVMHNPASSNPPTDLLAEFDKRMKIVESWEFTDDQK